MVEHRKPTLLVIDDSPASLKKTCEILTAAGHQVITAPNGLAGIRRVFKDTPAAVICDVVMPELNGYQLCRLLKNDATVAHIPVILLTSLGEERDRFWGAQAGAAHYVIKNSADAELPRVVAEVLAPMQDRAHASDATLDVSQIDLGDSAIKSKVSFLLEKLLFEQTLENEGRRLSHFIHSRDRFAAELFQLVARLVTYERAALLLKDRVAADLFLDSAEPVPAASEKLLLERAVQDSGNLELLGHHRVLFVRGRAAVASEDPASQPEPTIVSCRIASDTEYLGSLVLERAADALFTEDSVNILQLLARTISMTVKLMLLYEENRWLSVVDPRPGLYTRRYFMEHFEDHFRQFKRYHSVASLLFLDIDGFKLINDTHGHHVADMVLVQLAELLRTSVRTVDLPARLGGEEFVVLLPQTPAERGKILAERLRQKVEHYPFGHESESIKVTVSIGVSEFAEAMREAQELLNRADRAMYEAKLGGKNRVVVKTT